MEQPGSTVNHIRTHAMKVLADAFGQREARAMLRLIFEDVKGWSPAEVVMHYDDVLLPVVAHKILSITERASTGEPLQYILGKGWFHGMPFIVTPDTLIPRPETAELCDIIIDHWSSHKDLRVLDCGTGSGCIAITLSRNLPFSTVTAIDISRSALDIAKGNATALKAHVDFECRDILSLKYQSNEKYDIIVSNPPYITESEKATMNRNVLEHEPHTALFVPDCNPLKFYIPIAAFAAEALDRGGMMYLEINPLYANETKSMIEKTGLQQVEIIRDTQGKNRFITCSKQ